MKGTRRKWSRRQEEIVEGKERRVYKSVASEVKVTAQAKGHRHGDR